MKQLTAKTLFTKKNVKENLSLRFQMIKRGECESRISYNF